MDTYTPDKSGINSLGGFAYQIKVFISYMLAMDEQMEAGFETIDDVTIKKIFPETIDENEDKFRNVISSENGIKAIQVKRTAVDKKTSKQILLNWILLEDSEIKVTDYILFTDDFYGNRDILFDISAEDLYTEILSTKAQKSTMAKVKEKYQSDKEKFIKDYNEIKRKYEFVSNYDIDETLEKKCRELFKKGGVKELVYYNRIKALAEHITYEILKSINEKKPYTISYQEMMSYCEEICVRFTDDFMYPVYSEFKKINKISFDDLAIAKSREYKQLLACKLPQNMIETHLQYSSYYQNIRFKYMELSKIDRINDIEETTYENFEYVKCLLQSEGRDVPLQRLNETNKRPNSYAYNDQIRYGSGIYLTRDGEKERQISWEDEENAQS